MKVYITAADMNKISIMPKALKDLLPVWPNCATPDCPNKACVRLHSKFCDPCTHRLGAQGSAPVDYFSPLHSIATKQGDQ